MHEMQFDCTWCKGIAWGYKPVPSMAIVGAAFVLSLLAHTGIRRRIGREMETRPRHHPPGGRCVLARRAAFSG